MDRIHQVNNLVEGGLALVFFVAGCDLVVLVANLEDFFGDFFSVGVVAVDVFFYDFLGIAREANLGNYGNVNVAHRCSGVEDDVTRVLAADEGVADRRVLAEEHAGMFDDFTAAEVVVVQNLIGEVLGDVGLERNNGGVGVGFDADVDNLVCAFVAILQEFDQLHGARGGRCASFLAGSDHAGLAEILEEFVSSHLI